MGRGARTNASGRYERFAREAFDDGWAAGGDRSRSRPSSRRSWPRRIISTNQSPDISFDQSINPYRGCEHGCIYCYARPNHAYVGLSPGLDFETKLFVKANAAELLEQEFSKPSYRPQTIMLGGVTDIYQPIERGYGVTRAHPRSDGALAPSGGADHQIAAGHSRHRHSRAAWPSAGWRKRRSR